MLLNLTSEQKHFVLGFFLGLATHDPVTVVVGL